MIIKWLRARREEKERVKIAANDFISLHGGLAYYKARLASHAKGSEGAFYAMVKREIGRREGKEPLDTATRYLMSDEK